MSNLTGKSIGRYHILEPLGQGGMATVYKAYDTRLEREVALKIIRTEMFGSAVLENLLKRFEREAKSLAKLIHPNIVSIIDYGEYEGSPYLVEPYLAGGTLQQRLGQPMPWQEAARQLLPVARALQYAHDQGIIHRDVKPSNILITPSGELMLSDFGIAKILDVEAGQTLTGTGVGIGTPEYMAPEQWVGKVTPQSDIYSLGVVFYEMVTGRKPYTADTPAAVLLKQNKDPLPRPTQFVPGLPEDVEKFLLKSLAKRPEYRYRDMAFFAQTLEGLLSGRSIPAAKPTATKSLRTLEPQEEPTKQATINPMTGRTKLVETTLPAAPRGGIPFPLSQSPSRRRTWIIALIVLGMATLCVLGSLLFKKPATLLPTETSITTLTPLLTNSTPVTPTPVNPTLANPTSSNPTLTNPTPLNTSTSIPTNTPKPDPGTYYPIPGCAASRLHIGEWVKIEAGIDYVTIRSFPDTSPSDNRIGRLEGNTIAEIIGGPECSYGWILWKVQTEGSLVGWIPESDGKEFWLRKTQGLSSTSIPYSSPTPLAASPTPSISGVNEYFNDFNDLNGWVLNEGLFSVRCGKPVKQSDSKIYLPKNGKQAAGYLKLPSPILIEEGKNLVIEIYYRHNDLWGMAIGLSPTNDYICNKDWYYDGVFFDVWGGEGVNPAGAGLFLSQNHQRVDAVRVDRVMDDEWHMAQVIRSSSASEWSLYLDDRLLGSYPIVDDISSYKYLSFNAYGEGNLAEIDYIKVYQE
jgi:serine/threonine protein kinase